MSDVTQILSRIESGDPSAAEQLLPLVYNELRRLAATRMAQENPGQTLQATALVHDAYVRLVDVEQAQQWNSRGHFFAAASEAMRRILVEGARRRNRAKRGGRLQRHDVHQVDPAAPEQQTDVLALDEALTQLACDHPEKARLVQLRYFGGLTLVEAAATLKISSATADRHWRYARAWLARQLDAAAPAGQLPEKSG
jgi:RNA polymerase sigma factor (TIGR02999 family)